MSYPVTSDGAKAPGKKKKAHARSDPLRCAPSGFATQKSVSFSPVRPTIRREHGRRSVLTTAARREKSSLAWGDVGPGVARADEKGGRTERETERESSKGEKQGA